MLWYNINFISKIAFMVMHPAHSIINLVFLKARVFKPPKTDNYLIFSASMHHIVVPVISVYHSIYSPLTDRFIWLLSCDDCGLSSLCPLHQY